MEGFKLKPATPIFPQDLSQRQILRVHSNPNFVVPTEHDQTFESNQ